MISKALKLDTALPVMAAKYHHDHPALASTRSPTDKISPSITCRLLDVPKTDVTADQATRTRTISVTSFQSLHPDVCELNVCPADTATKRKAEFNTDALLADDRHRSDLIQQPRAKRFKLPTSRALSLKMRPSFLFQDTSTKRSYKPSQQEPLEAEQCGFLFKLDTPKALTRTPKELCRNCIYNTLPMVDSSSFHSVDGSDGPFPSHVCLPLF